MRFKTAISLPLLVCAAFFFRMYGASFFIAKPALTGHHCTFVLKRGTKDLHLSAPAETGRKTFLKTKSFKKNKAVRCKKFRMQAPETVRSAFIYTPALVACAPAHAPSPGLKRVALPRYLAISILRI